MEHEPASRLSFVIPVFNEAESLRELHNQLCAAASSLSREIEIIFIDDGSSDASWSEIERIHCSDARVSGIRFRRNFGKAAALQAGFAAATGERIITLDADLQDDPAEVHHLLSKIDEGFDLVSGWKRVRHDPWHKVLPSRVFNGMVAKLTGVNLHDINCGLKAYRSEVLQEIQLYGEFHRFTPVLAAARGFRIGEVEVKHRPRPYGHSKYGWRRFVSGMIDLLTVKFLTSFQHRPQHLMGLFGLGSMAIGGLGMTYLAIIWVLTRLGADFPRIGDRPLLIFSVTAVLIGLQIFSVGLLAELITFRVQREGQVFSVAKRLDSPLRKKSLPKSTNDST
ncbi:glycosyltransferase family 2 protein [bacterium]|nr:glycosyltransferase family 2 protein [bacterium]